MYKKINSITIFIAVIALVVGTFINAQAAPLPQTSTLLWSDEFSGTTLASNWARCFWWSGQHCTIETNNELELYTPNNVSLENGTLKFQARIQDPAIRWCGKYCRDYPYTSGMAMTGGNNFGTKPLFTFQYGYVEARIKVPAGKGLWPAFWMLPMTYNSRPEIDIMEILGDTPGDFHMNFHPKTGNNYGCVYKGDDLSLDYHTYAVDWQPNYIAWYLNGVERCRYTGSGVPAEKMYILLNLAVGGDWPGAPDTKTKFPADMFVDYVRVYASRPVGVPTATRVPVTATATTMPTTTPSPTQHLATKTPLPTNTTLPTSIPTSIPGEPYGYVQAAPSSIKLNETALVTVGLGSIPPEGFSGAEYSCTYAVNLVEVSNVAVSTLFGDDPVVAINGPKNGAFIVAIAGSQDKKATTDGDVFTFRVKGLQPGQTNIECKPRISKDDDVLTSLPSVSAPLVVLGSAPSPTLEPTTTNQPVFTPTPGLLPTATATPPSTGTFAGQVKASKPVTLEFYTLDNTLLLSQAANSDGSFLLDIPPGVYLVRIISSGFLSAQGQINLIAGQTLELSPLNLLAGDIDGNNLIDQFDALTIGMSYNTAFPESADLNSDGVINLLDLKLLARNYRQIGPSSW